MLEHHPLAQHSRAADGNVAYAHRLIALKHFRSVDTDQTISELYNLQGVRIESTKYRAS